MSGVKGHQKKCPDPCPPPPQKACEPEPQCQEPKCPPPQVCEPEPQCQEPKCPPPQVCEPEPQCQEPKCPPPQEKCQQTSQAQERKGVKK
ncbi:putative small proline-rich protein 5 isoform X4 [Dendropsophus ebraccatus]|uniref:putative small proline-rich protein 5 isoform X2 n=1 Tax=Dendropsophus ebraccatus TaxID=150705 RepID=UPI003831DDBF